MKTKTGERHARIYNEDLLYISKMNKTTKDVYLQLLFHARPVLYGNQLEIRIRVAKCAQATVAKKISKSERTVRKCINEIKEIGILEVQQKKAGCAHYIITTKGDGSKPVKWKKEPETSRKHDDLPDRKHDDLPDRKHVDLQCRKHVDLQTRQEQTKEQTINKGNDFDFLEIWFDEE